MKVTYLADQWDAEDITRGRGAMPRLPELTEERRAWLAESNAAAIRVACGFTLRTIAAAAGTDKTTIHKWESGRPVRRQQGMRAFARYCRIIAGLARHLEVSDE